MEPAMASSTAAKDQRINEVIMHSPNSYDQAITGERKSCASTLALMVSLFALLFVSVLANAQCVPNCLFYGGDFEPGNSNANALPNESDAIVGAIPYGAATFQNFVIPTGHTWDITSLFTNNITSLTTLFEVVHRRPDLEACNCS
jgi:hypothetical protein